MPPQATSCNVVCMKWGTKFPASDVNRLRSMVRRHLHMPHRFVCFTDDPAGLDADIENRPLPPVGWEAEPDINIHGWRKVGLFASPLADLEGPTLFLDLDVVIVDSLDVLLTYEGEFCVIRDYGLRWRGDAWVGNTSVIRFEAGAHPEIVEEFRRDFPHIRKQLRNEQEFVTRHFHRKGTIRYWPKAWCPSFKHDCVALGPASWFRAPRLPEGARIIVFHGKPKPEEAIEGTGGKWFRHILPTPWVAEHWH